MKRHLLMGWLLLAPLFCAAQVGIGTTTPNEKSILDLSSTSQGLLVPRMTGMQKSELDASAIDKGMVIFQTDVAQNPLPPSPKGLYYFDGDEWVAPVHNGVTNGQTLRWDGNSWVYTTNLFNQGSSIGIGTVAPKTQLHVHSNAAPTTRLQLTNSTTGLLTDDGLVVGVTLSNGYAHLLQKENKPLWFGTNGTEQMRIDSAGNVAIGRSDPAAKLDVNGTVKIGTSGTVLHGILKETFDVEIPAISAGDEEMVIIPFSGVMEGASVYASPGTTMAGLMIGYARVSSPGNIEVKFMNMDSDMDEPMAMVLHVSVIQ